VIGGFPPSAASGPMRRVLCDPETSNGVSDHAGPSRAFGCSGRGRDVGRHGPLLTFGLPPDVKP